jgi:hypothetical protein
MDDKDYLTKIVNTTISNLTKNKKKNTLNITTKKNV